MRLHKFTRTALRLITGLAAATTSIASDYSALVLEDNPIGYWRLGELEGEVAQNLGSLGEAGNGTLMNGVSLGAFGAIVEDSDTAAYFDGGTAKIEVPYADELNQPAFTVEVWANAGFVGGGHRSPISSRDDTPVGNTSGYIFYADPGDNWQFWTGMGAGNGWNNLGGALVNRGSWTHLVGTYENGIKRFYVNGVLVGINQSPIQLNQQQLLRIGGGATENPVGSFFWEGELDEVAVYDHALRGDRVLAHYMTGSGWEPEFYAPEIRSEPSPVIDLFKGDTLSLPVLAVGALPLTAVWTRDGEVIEGADDSIYEVPGAQPEHSGVYQVTITNPSGEITSSEFTVIIADISIPEITMEPRDRTVLPGSSASFTVQATGSAAFEYQWRFEDEDIQGATAATLVIPEVETANLGSYQVVVTNPAGSTTSRSATLQFPAEATQSYAATVLEDEPVAYWRLDETSGVDVLDSVGENHGWYFNEPALGISGALVDDDNPAAGFSAAAQQKADIWFNPELNTTEFTIELWARSTGGTGHRSPLTSRADAPQRGYIFYADPANLWQFWTGTGTGWDNISGPSVVEGSWAHLVGVYDGTMKSFYVNGVLVDRRPSTFVPNDTSPLRFGAGATEGDGTFWFEGGVDEVSFYNRALPEDRILAHYVAGFPLTTPPSITAQPLSQLVPPGANVVLSVNAVGGQPLSYQWRRDGEEIVGAVSSTLELQNIRENASYTVEVSNAGGAVTSEPALIQVPPAPTLSYAETILQDEPVGYWRLGESEGELALDEIAENHGALLNGVLLGVEGAVGSDNNTAARFTSANLTKIDVPFMFEYNGPEFTAEVWARSTGGAGHRSPLTSRGDFPPSGYIFYAEPGNTWQFWTGTGAGWQSVQGPAVATGAWTHLVGTYDGTVKRFYVNGVEVGSAATVLEPNPFNPLRIGAGASETDGSFFFEGDVDEVAIYDKALSHERIIYHYAAALPSGVNGEPHLTITRQEGQIVLDWDSGVLQESETVDGEWQAVPNAESPLTIAPSGSQKFYRAVN